MAPLRQHVFHISPDWCGEAALAAIFRANGHACQGHRRGALACDVAMAAIRGTAPLRAHPQPQLFTGLWRIHLPARPPLEAWRLFPQLDRHYPEARFILTTRDPDGWLLDRLTRDRGAALRCYMNHLGQTEEAVIEGWLRGWHDHHDAVERYFGADRRLIRLDLDRDPLALASSRLDLPRLPDETAWLPPAEPGLEAGLIALLDGFGDPAPVADMTCARDLASFCLRGSQPIAAIPGARAAGSSIAAEWRGGAGVRDRDGRALDYAIGELRAGQGHVAVASPDLPFKQLRAEGVVNDILRLGRRDPVRIDMEDARWLGSDPSRMPDRPVLCHNRRAGARGVVLWPLPDQHVPGLPGFATADCPDRIPFDLKQDRLAWRGHISGAMRRADGMPGPSSHRLLLDLRAAAGDRAREAAIFEDLCRTQRLAFLRRWIDHRDFDIGMVLAWSLRDLADHPLLAPYARPARPASWFHGFRYQLNISGYDHGSNFLGAANSRSVVLKEEDGWEVYYLGRFKPWKHYIPLARDCADIAEKLAWARANPLECQNMSQAARAEVARLANPATRREMMRLILDGLAASG